MKNVTYFFILFLFDFDTLLCLLIKTAMKKC